LVRTNYKYIIDQLIKNGVVTTCLELFFSYPWNNFLHSTVYTMIESILTGGNEELEVYLITETKLLEKIAQAARENDEGAKKPKGFRRGNMGHITLISLLLIEKAQTNNNNINKLLQESKDWKEYTSEGGSLADIRKKESSTLGISSPFYEDNEENEEEGHFNMAEEEEEEEDNTIVRNETEGSPKDEIKSEKTEEETNEDQ